MNRKNKIIIGLVCIAVVLFVLVQFAIIPSCQNKRAEQEARQADALTHDITSIYEYKNQYIGDASNVSNLFHNLPLNNIPMQFEIDSEKCSLTINYLETVWSIGEEKVERDFIYNSAAAFAAIDNLSGITYNFSGDCYSIDRTQMEEELGESYAELLDEKIWKENVQKKLDSADFVAQFFSAKSQTQPTK